MRGDLRRWHRRCVVSIIAVQLTAVQASSEIVLVGTPTSSTHSNPDGATHGSLSTEERSEFRVVIDQSDGSFRWTSRGDVEMFRRTSGIYDVYVATDGSGYVKVERGELVGSENRYIEHIHVGLGTVTYFGENPYYRP